MYTEQPISGDKPVNIGTAERTLSALLGAFVITSVAKRHKSQTLLFAAGGYLLYRAVTGHCSFYALAGDPRNINLKMDIVVNRPRNEVFALWKDLEGLPRFMKHLGSVHRLDDHRSVWQIGAPGGMPSVQWTAETVKEEEGKELSWRSLPHATIKNSGKINFSDTPGGATRIDLHLSYRPPLGKVGEELAWLFNGMLKKKVREDIDGFKHFAENQIQEKASY
jgi:uncharacterized membrane protein